MDLQIKRIQKEKGINNLQLADLLGVSGQYAGALANGKVRGSIDKYEEIANALGVKLWQLFAPLDEYVIPDGKIEETNENIKVQLTDSEKGQDSIPDIIIVDVNTGVTKKYKLLS